MSKLTRQELNEIVDKVGELEDGESVNIHHCKEGEGNDRCYVSKRGAATLVYCFHCGGGGSVMEKYHRVKVAKKKNNSSGIFSGGYDGRPVNPPSDAKEDTSEWSVGALGWVGGGGLTTTEVKKYGLRYSESRGRVYLPLYNEGELVGYQARQIESDAPKYITRANTDFTFYINNHTEECVIVEDILSAIKVGRQYSVIALLGTSMSDYALSKVAGDYIRYKVWLDNDNPQVKMKQVKVRNTLDVYAPAVVIKTDKDPKEYTDSEIKEIVNEC